MDNSKTRLNRLQRIMNLQHRLKQQHEWQLVELQHQQEQVAKDRIMLTDSLDQPKLSGERLLDLIGKQLSQTNQKEHAIANARIHHHHQHEEQYRRLKFVEKVYHNAAANYQRGAFEQELTEVVDVALLGKNKAPN